MQHQVKTNNKTKINKKAITQKHKILTQFDNMPTSIEKEEINLNLLYYKE